MQSEIYSLLCRNRKAMTASQISSVLKIGRDTAHRSLNQLAKYRLVKKTQHKVKIRTQTHRIFKYRAMGRK